MSPEFPYTWAWGQPPATDVYGPRTSGWFDRCRKGEPCRVLAPLAGGPRAMNSALVEFEDGYRVVTSRNGLRRA